VAGAVFLACNADGSMFPVLFSALELALVAVNGRAVVCAFYVACDPYDTSMACT
jgi:hypothetical protein